jgi:hypothetical protein
MKSSTIVISPRNPDSRPRRQFGHWRRLLATGLTLGLTALVQTARADVVILDDDFNDPNNRLTVNTNGIGGGFGVFTASTGFTRETNGLGVIGNTGNGAGRANIASQNPMDISAVGTLFDFQNVRYTNTVVGGAPNTDRLIIGVIATNVASDWFESSQAGLPGGFYIEPNSESIALGGASALANSYWTNHTSCLFYKDPYAGTVTILTNWQFKTLAWNGGSGGGPGGYGTNYTPVLDVQLTLSATGWHLFIGGDVNTNNAPIDFAGTYAASGINNIFLNGIDNGYIGTEVQSEGPCLQQTIDRIVVTHLGNLVVTTPKFYTPEYGGNVNTVFAGEAVSLSSLVVDSSGTPTLQWQLENLSSPGTFTNLPGATATNLDLDTSGLGDSLSRGIRLLANDGLNSVTSAVVALTVKPGTVPVLSQPVSPSVINLYAGSGATFRAGFIGNKPMTYQWQISPDDTTWTDIPNATNIYYIIASAGPSDAGFYQIVVSNAFGITRSSDDSGSYGYLQILPGTPFITWSAAYPISGLNAEQILANFPSANKVAGALVGGTTQRSVTLTNAGNEVIVFARQGSTAWANVTGGTGSANGASTNRTGNSTFDTVLNTKYRDNGQHVVVMSNLVVGQQYQVQLFALDTGSSLLLRQAFWQNPSDAANVSATFTMGDNSFMLGTFTATNAVQPLWENLIGDTANPGTGNFNCLVLRTVGWNPPPYWLSQPRSLTGNYPGNSVSVSGSAAGDTTIPSPAVAYQWQAGPAGGPYTNLVESAKYVGATSNNLTITGLNIDDSIPAYVLIAANGGGSTTSSVANVFIAALPQTNLVGEWFSGSASLADVSSFTPGGVHDGFLVGPAGTNYLFTNDIPPGATGQALYLYGDTAIAIGNSATSDGSYTNTYDDGISNSFTIMCWAKGFPGTWNPWVSKYGETGAPAGGWQLRRYSGNNDSVFTIRGTGSAADDPEGNIQSNNGQWHHYAGTYDAVTGIRTLYVDGVAANTQTANGKYALSPVTHLMIGGRDAPPGSTYGAFYTGILYDVRIYSYALTRSQIGTDGHLPPPITRQVLPGTGGGPGQLVVSWTWGTLLEATNVAGPWNTTTNTSPFTNLMTLPSDFYKVQNP